MRLRVCTKAEDHTRQASMLAQNLAQSEMARTPGGDDSNHDARRSRTRRLYENRGFPLAACGGSGIGTEVKRKLWQRWTPADHAAGPSACAAARHPASRREDRCLLCSRFGIPPILGELMVGVVLGSRHLQSAAPASLFEDGHATSTLAASRANRRLRIDVHRGHRNRHRPHARSQRHCVCRGALRRDLAVFAWRRSRTPASAFHGQTACFLGRSAHRNERFHFRAHLDGRRANVLARRHLILGAAVIDDVMGLFVLAFLAASTTTKGEAFGLAPMASAWLQQQIAPWRRAHPLIVQMIDDQHLRGSIFRRRIRRGQTLAEPADSSASQAYGQRSGSELRFRAGSGLRALGGMAGQRSGNHRRLFARLRFRRFGISRRMWSAAFTPSATAF